MTIECDVLVVGGGPAGLSAALTLVKKGDSSVIVLEKKNSCGSTRPRYDITEADKETKRIFETLGLNPLKRTRTSEWFFPDKEFMMESEVEDFYFLRGNKTGSIENFLTRNLEASGVKILSKVEIKRIKMMDKKIEKIQVSYNGTNTEIKPSFVVASDGTFSLLREKLNVKKKILARFKGVGILMEAKGENAIPNSRVYFDSNIAPGGYIYVGSVKRDVFFCLVVDYDLIKEKKNRLVSNLELFLDCEYKKLLDRWKFKNYFGGVGISGTLEVIHGNIVLTGGAALLHDPLLGYGLNYAIQSGYYAGLGICNGDLGIYDNFVKQISEDFKEKYFLRDALKKKGNGSLDILVEYLKQQ